MELLEVLGAINDGIWIPMAYFALAVGLIFTIVTGAVQFRRIPDMIREIKASPLLFGFRGSEIVDVS